MVTFRTIKGFVFAGVFFLQGFSNSLVLPVNAKKTSPVKSVSAEKAYRLKSSGMENLRNLHRFEVILDTHGIWTKDNADRNLAHFSKMFRSGGPALINTAERETDYVSSFIPTLLIEIRPAATGNPEDNHSACIGKIILSENAILSDRLISQQNSVASYSFSDIAWEKTDSDACFETLTKLLLQFRRDWYTANEKPTAIDQAGVTH